MTSASSQISLLNKQFFETLLPEVELIKNEIKCEFKNDTIEIVQAYAYPKSPAVKRLRFRKKMNCTDNDVAMNEYEEDGRPTPSSSGTRTPMFPPPRYPLMSGVYRHESSGTPQRSTVAKNKTHLKQKKTYSKAPYEPKFTRIFQNTFLRTKIVQLMSGHLRKRYNHLHWLWRTEKWNLGP
ncbi:hypothetical protein TKK_0006495 [Trichogramma kaykai]